ncbi:MAG: XrtV sorting system accessory protein [Hyphococcus sp.]
MGTVFDLLALLLFAAAVVLFASRRRRETPPLAPYLLISLVSIVGNWLGNHGGGPAAVGLLMAGSFLALHLAGEPFREEPERPGR